MSKLSLDKFLVFVQRSNLVEPDRLAEVVHEWKRRASLAQLDDAHDCAEHLVESGLLTQWQARKLLEGRHRGFLLGRYKLLDHLGSGGMSSVYLAQHTLMHRLVAIKVLPQHRVNDGTYLARFHLEGQCAAALDHPNIVRAYDLDNDGKIHYLVMEYVDGRDLQAIVESVGPLDVHAAANFVGQAAAGLQHAHDAGLVHRDIKPANLLVDRAGALKILDMGLAKFAAAKGPSADLARDEHVLGTADYLAPEQAVNSSAVDHRADIYSLGCTLYFLLTGHAPFPAGSAAERMTAHQRETPAGVLLERPDAPAALVALCQRMMAKSPRDRPQTAAEVHAELAAWLQEEAVAGRVRHPAGVLVGQGGPADSGVWKTKPRRHDGSDASPCPPSSDALSLSSPLSETDSNLHRGTEKIPAPGSGVRSESSPPSASQSHVLHPDLARYAAPPSNPVVPPLPPVTPPSLMRAAAPQVPPVVPFGSVRSVAPGSATPVDVPIVGHSPVAWVHANRARRRGNWLAVTLLSSLILAAIFLAVFALSR
ncbi:MAG: serine/threonine-protein kinase [Pirellulales bacterium]